MTGTLRKKRPGPWSLVHGLFLCFYRRTEQRAEPRTAHPAPCLPAHCCSAFFHLLIPYKDLRVRLSIPASSPPTDTVYAYSTYVCVCTYTYCAHTYSGVSTGSFILLAARKCLAQLKSAKAGTMTADLLINEVKWQKQNFSLVTQLREKQYSH